MTTIVVLLAFTALVGILVRQIAKKRISNG